MKLLLVTAGALLLLSSLFRTWSMLFFGHLLFLPTLVVLTNAITAIVTIYSGFSAAGSVFAFWASIAGINLKIIESVYFFIALKIPLEAIFGPGFAMSLAALFFIAYTAYGFSPSSD